MMLIAFFGFMAAVGVLVVIALIKNNPPGPPKE